MINQLWTLFLYSRTLELTVGFYLVFSILIVFHGVVLLAGAVQCFLGHFLMWAAVVGLIPRPPVPVMCLFTLLAAHAQSFFNTSNVVTGVRNFPNYKGTIVGIMKFVFSVLGISWFEWSNNNPNIPDVYVQKDHFVSSDAITAASDKYFVAYVVCEIQQQEGRKREATSG
ncbi:hypothetical protein ACLB2K_052209 [Fragaria x ananassa]